MNVIYHNFLKYFYILKEFLRVFNKFCKILDMKVIDTDHSKKIIKFSSTVTLRPNKISFVTDTTQDSKAKIYFFMSK